MSTCMTSLPLLTQDKTELPIVVLQFGEGNFLRGFVDWMFDRLNKEAQFGAGVHLVQPVGAEPAFVLQQLQKQDHAYTVLLRGLKDGERFVEEKVVNNIVASSNAESQWADILKTAEQDSLRFVISNTTEAGIVHENETLTPNQCPKTFPAKITALLYHRFQYVQGAADKGLLFVPCELIESNGAKLKSIILQYAEEWSLGAEFVDWVNKANHFANTLVDRIVPGFPKDEIDEICQKAGYRDDIVVCGEPYHLWAIEGDEIFQRELPFEKTDLNVVFTTDLAAYRSRKVKVLNGVHTMSVLLSHLMGIETVRESLGNPLLNSHIRQGAITEIAPTIDMDEQEKMEYIEGVMERFANPFMKHFCLTISLNSISKFKVRVLPTMLEYMAQTQKAPACLSLALASLIRFYKITHHEQDRAMGTTDQGPYPIQDNPEFLSKMEQLWQQHENQLDTLTHAVLAESSFWGQDLSKNSLLLDAVSLSLKTLVNEGPEQAIRHALGV